MKNDTPDRALLKKEWSLTVPVKVNDVCVYEPWGQDFMCFEIIPYNEFEYLYFGSFNYEDTLFAIQVKKGDKNYLKVLTEKPQQEFAFRLYKDKD